MPKAMQADEAVAFAALQALIAEYWARVDRQEGATEDPCESFFTEDAVMVLGALRVEGKPGLATFFANRELTELARERTTRHFTTNHRIKMDGPSRATMYTNIAVFSCFGAWPQPSEAPSGVGDFSFRCVKDAQGVWRIAAINANSILTGASAPAFAKAPPQQSA